MANEKDPRGGERNLARSGQAEGGRGEIEPRGAYGLRNERGVTPFSFIGRMMQDMDRLLMGGVFGEEEVRPGALLGTPSALFTPQIEMFEREGSLVVRADLPGLDRDDVKVDLDEGVLTIQGERRSQQEEDRDGWYHSERSYGSFSRSIRLPRGIDASSCDALFENGVLEIKMKMSKSSGKRVEIRGGAGQPTQQAEREPVREAPVQNRQGGVANGPGPTSRPH